jgi:hypothetical protein
MLDRDEHHNAVGWSEDHRFRWIEVGRLRLEEDDNDGAIVTLQDRGKGCWLSATELAMLTRHLASWFAEDPSEKLDEIEAAAKRVHDALEEWNARARMDEEHPPYDDLTRALDGLVVRCKHLREDLGKFADKEPKIITVKAD